MIVFNLFIKYYNIYNRKHMKENQQQSQISDLSLSSSPSANIQNINFQAPQTSANCTLVASLFFLGFYFLVFTVVQLITNYKETSYTYQLNKDNNIFSVTTGFLSFQTNDVVSIYLRFPKITQMDVNIMAQPFANNQQNQDQKNCRSFRTNKQIRKTLNMLGAPLNQSDNAIPCGYYTSLYPDGLFQITNTETSQQLAITSKNLVNFKSQIQEIDQNKQWTDITTERFKSWNQNQASVTLTKYWGQIQGSVSGTYLVELSLSNPILYKGKINLVLSNNAALGGYNIQLLFLNLCYSIVSFLGSLISFIINKKFGKKTGVKQKAQISSLFGQSNQIKVYLGSGNTTPGLIKHE